MTRLIYADELMKYAHDVTLGNGARHRCIDATVIYAIPTVDAVPVIRCKDCLYNLQLGTEIRCRHRQGLNGRISADDYCSLAERKEE